MHTKYSFSYLFAELLANVIWITEFSIISEISVYNVLWKRIQDIYCPKSLTSAWCLEACHPAITQMMDCPSLLIVTLCKESSQHFPAQRRGIKSMSRVNRVIDEDHFISWSSRKESFIWTPWTFGRVICIKKIFNFCI